MSVDKLTVLLDAAQTPKPRSGATVRDYISAAALHERSISNGVWVEPYSRTVMMQPLQFGLNFYQCSSVPRHDKARWNLTDAHWDEITRVYDKWLMSDGTDEQITTKAVFSPDEGYCLDFFLYGPETDTWLALRLLFGQWQLDIYSSGEAKLYRQGENEPRTIGWVVSRHGTTLAERRSQLIIAPSANRTLFVRRNQIAGFAYQIPESEWISDGREVIRGGYDFKLTAPSSTIQFQLTPLAYETDSGGYYWISPNRQMATIPESGQTFDLTLDFENTRAGITYGAYNERATDEGLDDLSIFVADGASDTYCVGVNFLASTDGKYTGQFTGVVAQMDPAEPDVMALPGDISDDIVAASLSVNNDPWQTNMALTVRYPEYHPILGECNRRCIVKIGDTVILDGVLNEPPKLICSDSAADKYELSVHSLIKYAEIPSLPSFVTFDRVDHTDAMRWLFLVASCIPAELLECQDDSTPLRDSRTGAQLEHSELRTQIADTPREWMDKLCKETQWLLGDGPLTDGNFGFTYQDPLALNTTPTHTFYVQSDDAGEEGSYDRIHSRLHVYDIEPEANETHIVGCNEYGQLVDCVYADSASQDPDTTEGSRPKNWLGYVKIATIPIPGFVPEWLLKRVALRIGRELASVVRMVDFEADWKPGLWRNSVVTIDVGDSGAEGAGNYRIETMDVEFRNETSDYPIRRANYTAVKLDPDYAAQARQTADSKLLEAVGYYLRFGPQVKSISRLQESDVPGQKDKGNVLDCSGPVAKVINVINDAGLEEFVLGANGMDATTIVR